MADSFDPNDDPVARELADLQAIVRKQGKTIEALTKRVTELERRDKLRGGLTRRG